VQTAQSFKNIKNKIGLQFLQADFFVPMRFQQKSERVFLKIFNLIFTF